MHEEYLEMDNSENLLNNPSSNQDAEILITYQDQNSEIPKQYNDIFVEFLKSNSIHHSETLQEVVTDKSRFKQKINITQVESSRIDYHNQPSTSKQLFNIIEPNISTQSGYKMHYYDIDQLSIDNQEQGVIKRPRLNWKTKSIQHSW